MPKPPRDKNAIKVKDFHGTLEGAKAMEKMGKKLQLELTHDAVAQVCRDCADALEDHNQAHVLRQAADIILDEWGS